MTRRLIVATFALASVVVLAGCHSVTFYAGPPVNFVMPARAPFFAAARVLIIIPPDAHGRILANRLGGRLSAEGTATVLVVDATQAPSARLPGSLVVRLHTTVTEGVSVAVHSTGGVSHMPWGRAHVHVTAYDGPAGTVIQELEYQERASDIQGAMLKVEQLLFGDVAPKQESLVSSLPQLLGHGFREASGHMLAGRWSVAVGHLESHASDTFENEEEEAAFHFALGSCHRFAAMQDARTGEAAFQRAIASLERAARLQPRSLRYINALSAARGNLVDLERLQAQLETRRRNQQAPH